MVFRVLLPLLARLRAGGRPQPISQRLPATTYSGVAAAPPPPPDGASAASPAAGGAAELSQRLPRVLTPARLANPSFGPAELAAALHLTPRTLCRHLKALTGLTPAAWLRAARLDRARTLLRRTPRLRIAEVARRAGFADPDYFSKLFIQRFGHRPSDNRG